MQGVFVDVTSVLLTIPYLLLFIPSSLVGCSNMEKVSTLLSQVDDGVGYRK